VFIASELEPVICPGSSEVSEVPVMPRSRFRVTSSSNAFSGLLWLTPRRV
jgi:hypothetical protein